RFSRDWSSDVCSSDLVSRSSSRLVRRAWGRTNWGKRSANTRRRQVGLVHRNRRTVRWILTVRPSAGRSMRNRVYWLCFRRETRPHRGHWAPDRALLTVRVMSDGADSCFWMFRSRCRRSFHTAAQPHGEWLRRGSRLARKFLQDATYLHQNCGRPTRFLEIVG